MTITPTGASPAPGGAVAGAPAPGSSDSGFADLVRQHLESGFEGSADEGAEGLLTTEQAAALLEAASAPSAVPSEGLAALLAGLLAGSTASRTGSAPADTASASAASEADATVPAGAVATLPATAGAPGAVLTDGVPANLAGATGATASPVARAAQARVLADGQVQGAGVPATDLHAVQSAQVDPPAQADALPDGTTPDKPGALGSALLPGDTAMAGASTAAGADGAGQGPLASQAPGAISATSGGAGAAGGTGSVAEGPASHPVTDQVFGQVTRLVSRGDGTHRLTLRLHPADLGEVKVVLTVKDGAVDVSLSAGPAAREALRDGSPQLRALLELTGATTAHVVVRDAAGNALTGAGGQQATGQQPSGAGTGDAHDQGTDPDLASRGDLADGSTDGSPNGNGEADGGAATAPGLSGPGALAGVRVRPGEATAAPGTTQHTSLGIPARLDLNL